MAWKIEVSREAQKAIGKLGAVPARRIAAGLRQIAELENPRDRGKALTGNQSGHWRYRIGDYRVICQIEDGRLVIVVIALGHRREIYR
ncbi:MAG: type II toxin-antitoxin system RelE/ParE family toxin [Sphingomonadaceae bacterium]|nr:type II toxin-antitoxin system RelE/ParE family toxin [Sphingomonadaceae bacterium]